MKKLLIIVLSTLLILSYSCKKDDNALKINASKIVINPTNLYMIEGGANKTATANILPIQAKDKSVKWSVENTEIATVDAQGVVTPLKIGSTNLIAKTHNNIKAICPIKITKEAVEIKEINIKEKSKTGISIVKGTSKTLNLIFTPENATDTDIYWESANEEIVSVEEGTITAIKEGKTVISAEADNGIKVKCLVIVTEKEVVATEINIDTKELTVLEGKKKVINANILPENTTNTALVWTSSDESIASVENTGQVTCHKGGTVDITATTANGLKATCKLNVKGLVWATSMEVIGKNVMEVEGEQTLDVRFTPEICDNRSFLFTSSNPEVATVDEKDHVIAIKAGQTTMTVTTHGDVTAKFVIIVTPPNPPFVYEGKSYKTVLINGVTWMSENFAYLPNVSNKKTVSEKEAHIYVYDYEGSDIAEAKETENYKTHGALYNYAAAVKYTPKGWHLPTHQEMKDLEKAFGMSEAELDDESYGGRGDIALKFKSPKEWKTPGTNETGLKILPAGTLSRDYINDGFKFSGQGKSAGIWTSTEGKSLKSYAYSREFEEYKKLKIVANDVQKQIGYSVRYVKDSE